MGLPFSTGPITDTSGAQCALGQSGPVWYLAGTVGGAVTRTCDIPKHKALYFPLVNSWSIPSPHLADTSKELAAFVAWATGFFANNRAHTCQLTLRLGGRDLLADTSELYI